MKEMRHCAEEIGYDGADSKRECRPEMLVSRESKRVWEIEENEDYGNDTYKMTPYVECFVVQSEHTKKIVIPGSIHGTIAGDNGGLS